jgi:hypothetical protein
VQRESRARPGLPDRWFATDGVSSLGPLSFDALVRSVAHAEISEACLVRHACWNTWQAMDDVRKLSEASRNERVDWLAEASAHADLGPTGSQSRPICRPTEPVRSPMPAHPSVRPAAIDPAGVMASVDDRDALLMLALSTATATATAQSGLLVGMGSRGPLVFCTLGNGCERLLGKPLEPTDPSLVAAERGVVVVGEPETGDTTSVIASRLAGGKNTPRGIAMVPLVVDGTLVAAVELARAWRPFRACEIARVEEVLEALAARAVVMGWLE